MTIRIVEEAECLVGQNSKIKYNEKKSVQKRSERFSAGRCTHMNEH